MARVRIPDADRTIDDPAAIAAFLGEYGIDFERWSPAGAAPPVAMEASADRILAAYGAKIDELKARGGYITADVIDVKPDTPGLDGMLAKFNSEHWHDEDEVRFI